MKTLLPCSIRHGEANVFVAHKLATWPASPLVLQPILSAKVLVCQFHQTSSMLHIHYQLKYMTISILNGKDINDSRCVFHWVGKILILTDIITFKAKVNKLSKIVGFIQVTSLLVRNLRKLYQSRCFFSEKNELWTGSLTSTITRQSLKAAWCSLRWSDSQLSVS